MKEDDATDMRETTPHVEPEKKRRTSEELAKERLEKAQIRHDVTILAGKIKNGTKAIQSHVTKAVETGDMKELEEALNQYKADAMRYVTLRRKERGLYTEPVTEEEPETEE